MAKTRLCVDINCGQISGVLMKITRKGIRAIKSFTIDNPGYDFYKGSIYEVENIAEEIKFAMAHKRISAKEVIVCTNHQDIVLEEAVIPVANNGIYKDHAVRLEERSKRESKSKLKATYLKGQVLIDTSNMANIVTVLMPQYVVDRCQALASYLNMKLVGLVDSGCAACIAYKKHLGLKHFVIDLREEGTYIYFVDNGIIRAKEFVPFKSSSVIELVKENRSCKSFSAATKLMQDDMILLTAQRLNNEPYKKLGSESHALIQNLCKTIDLTIQKILTRLHTDFNDISLVGIGASFAGIEMIMSSKFGVPVTALANKINDVDCDNMESDTYYDVSIHDILAASALPEANLLWIDNYRIGDGNSLLDIIYRFLFGD